MRHELMRKRKDLAMREMSGTRKAGPERKANDLI